MNLSLKIISAVSQATAPLLSYEIAGTFGLLSAALNRLAASSSGRNILACLPKIGNHFLSQQT